MRDLLKPAPLRPVSHDAKGRIRNFGVNLGKCSQSNLKAFPVNQSAKTEKTDRAHLRRRKVSQYLQLRFRQTSFGECPYLAAFESSKTVGCGVCFGKCQHGMPRCQAY